MKKIFAILNWSRDFEKPLESLRKAMDDNSELILCTNQKVDVANTHIIEADPSVSKSKNKILQKAIDLKGDYLFLMEDDLALTKTEIVDEYVALMKKYELGFCFYGFNNQNIVFKRPNPSVLCHNTSDGKNVICVRFPCDGFLVFDLSKIKDMRFNKSLQALELHEFLLQCVEEKLIPFNGFYFDVDKSYEAFENLQLPPSRIVTNELIKADETIMQSKHSLDIENNVDKFLKYVVEHDE